MSDPWRCPCCDQTFDLGEIAWVGFGDPSSPAVCPDCGPPWIELEINEEWSPLDTDNSQPLF